MKEIEVDVFPKWKYHREKTAKIFHSEDEFRAAGKGWVDSPAKIEDPEPEKEFLNLDDLTKKELSKILIETYGVNESTLNRVNKDELIKMVKEEKGK
jgi:hypothetical protein